MGWMIIPPRKNAPSVDGATLQVFKRTRLRLHGEQAAERRDAHAPAQGEKSGHRAIARSAAGSARRPPLGGVKQGSARTVTMTKG